METAKQPEMMSTHRAAIICFVVATTVFLNSLENGFCFDDLSAIEQNKDLRAQTPWSNLIWNDFWGTPMHVDGSHKSYRPLCVATFRLNYLLHELQPMGYHLVNVLLHGAVCYLYVQLCGVVFSQVWPALIAGLLFAVHPIHTEAVAGVVGRAETLSSIFFLLTIFCYMRGCRSNTYVGMRWVCLSLVMCFCSMLSKEQGITAVAVCFTYDLFIARNLNLLSLLKELSLLKRGVTPRWFRQLILRAATLVAFTIALMVLRVKIMRAELPVFTVHDNPAVTQATPYRQLHWCYLVFVNCWLLLQPSFLCADWTMGTIPIINSVTDVRNLLTMATLISVCILSWYSITRVGRTAKVIIISLALMVFPFIPASNLFFPVGFVVAERVLYVPSMGFCMLVALGMWYLTQHSSVTSKLVKVSLVYLLLMHSTKTIVRNKDWKSDNELFVSAIKINPQNGKLYNNLGHEHESHGDFQMAEKLFRAAASIQPDDIGAYINLGRALKALGRNEEAEQVYKKAVDMMPTGRSFRVAPNYINVYYNLANLVRLDSSRTLEAYELYQKALSMKPDFVEAHMNKGDLLLRMNKSADAKVSFEKALQYNPEYTDAHYNLATALVQLGEKREAERSYKRALAMEGTHLYSLLSLGTLLHEDGRLNEAKEFLERALHQDPDNIRAMSQLAVVYLDQQDIEKSEQILLRSLAIDPDYRSSLYNLAVIYNHRQQYADAVRLLRRLVSHYPEHTNGLQLLGDCFMRLHQVEEAERIYKDVLSQHPDHVSALHNLGVVKASGGDFPSAIQLFSRVLELNPSHEAAKRHITEARLQQMQEHNTAVVNKSNTGRHRQPSPGKQQTQRVTTSNSSHKRTA